MGSPRGRGLPRDSSEVELDELATGGGGGHGEGAGRQGGSDPSVAGVQAEE